MNALFIIQFITAIVYVSAMRAEYGRLRYELSGV
jgi:hypothetical protein